MLWVKHFVTLTLSIGNCLRNVSKTHFGQVTARWEVSATQMCVIFTGLPLCSLLLVYCRNNYYKSVENPFIIQFYFLNAVSEGRLVHILNVECKGGCQVFIYIIFYQLREPSIPFCIILHCLLAAFTCHIIPTFTVSTPVNLPSVCVYPDNTSYSGVLYFFVKFMFCYQGSFLSLW